MSTYTSAGVVLDRYADILARLHAQAKSKWGDSVDLELDSYHGHELNLISLIDAEINEIVQELYDSQDISNASGAALDAAVSFLGLERQSAAPSTIAQIQLTLSKGNTVPAGSQYKTAQNVIFEIDEAVTATAAGDYVVAGTCTENGAKDVAIGELDSIVTAGYSVTAVTNLTAAIPGRDRATDSEVKQAHSLAVETSGLDDVASLYEALLQVTGVQAVYIYDNDTTSAVGSIPAHSIYVVVIGGTDDDIAAAIDNNKTGGVGTYGSENVAVYNSTTKQSKTINFDRGADVSIYVKMTIQKLAGVYPDDGDNTIKEGMATLYDDKELNDDVIYNEHWGKIYSVPGVTVNSLYVGLSDPPTGTIDIAMTAQQRPSLDVVRNADTDEITSINVEIVEA